ncbi:YdiU family protein [Leucobacter sp. CSA1]|uniref:Protein nucleotidyltransferase YdiU n=1 Tax=Leucobacter chromiisoli TaxID=2796471 RepID=A0A934Q984_9MICO|nr:YdiU family protein [Leucobacter chromiisoli]MBK0419620.1 YdiU family protein [Leucobacter chromiisoli]
MPGVSLGDAFARDLPEMAIPWRAMEPEEPSLLMLNEELAGELGLDADALRSETGVRFLLGNALAEGSRPVAQVYAGHQFGGYVPRLGDGRALLLGEAEDTAGRLRDLHLKGSGRTPLARADGFAAVGPMLREYAMGEAMHALGIPTTRALAVVGTGRLVPRDTGLLPGAVLVRVASSHLRVGSFQYARSTGDADLLRRLADHAIARHFPHLAETEAPYLGLLEAVIAAQARLLASWMLVGFVHGVMNTDNTTISGETIDYGPCAFIDAYDPAAVFSSIDHGGRYAYGNQPRIALWNLTRFAETLLPLLAETPEAAVELAEQTLVGFGDAYGDAWIAGMRAKLGIAGRPGAPDPDAEQAAEAEEEIARIAVGALEDLQARSIDYTGFFRALAEAARGREDGVRSLFAVGAGPGEWFDAWLALGPDGDAMDRVNPVYIPRNHLVDEALDAATIGDPAPFETLLGLLTSPFEHRPGFDRYALPAPEGSGPHRTYCGT